MKLVRIGYLTSQYPATSHTFIRREVAELRARGWDVQTFSIRKPAEVERQSDIEQVEYRQTWYVLPPRADILVAIIACFVTAPVRFFRVLGLAVRHRVPGLRGFAWSFFYFVEAMYLARELKKRNIDHLHNHFGNAAAIVGLLATRYLRLTWSLSMHGVSEFDYPAGLLIGEKIAAVDFAPCCAHFTRSQAMRYSTPEHWDKLFVTHCGLDLDRLRGAAKAAPERRSPRLRVLSVARLAREKGLDGLLQAVAKLVEHGVDAELRLVGDGPDSDHVQARASALGIADRCSFAGRLSEEDVPAEYAHADIFVMSSLMEGLPVVLMEALALDVPVVAPHVAGIPELVVHDETGLLYRPADWDDLAAQLIRLANDPELRRRLADNGRRRVEEEFEIGRAVEPLHRRFERLREQQT